MWLPPKQQIVADLDSVVIMVKVTAPSYRTASRQLRNVVALRTYLPYAMGAMFLGVVIVRVYFAVLHTIWTCPDLIGDDNKQDMCFVTCIFGDSVDHVDHPANVEWFANHWCQTRFLLVTNLPTLSAPGWNKVIQEVPIHSSSHSDSDPNSNNNRNYIVQSREAKFLAWKVLPVQHCGAVFYMDGYLAPRFSWTPSKFKTIMEQVQAHPFGLSQVKQKYFDGLTMSTILMNLVRDRKDTTDHVNATLTWLNQQDDYQEVMTYYLNKYFAYDPNNENYRQLSSWFWEQYTTYGGLWRDQPLWAYALHHFNCTPAVMTTRGTITKGGDLFQTGGTIGWDQHVYVSAKDNSSNQ